MKKLLLILFCTLFSATNLFAQRDTEHWIAPFFETSSNNGRSLYLSTDSVTPFVVTISSNNVVIGTTTISKGSPQVFPVAQQYIATSTSSDAFTVKNFGLHLLGSQPFYCTLRLASSTTHAEILTSKGRAGLGNEFFVANTPSIYSGSTLFNFTAGVLATEDNTTVTATWPTTTNPIFINGNPTGNTQTFTLNKGQSFIFAGNGANASNIETFIGAKIVSNKPITLTNGNNNGNFGLVSNSGSDIIMDQSVPVNQLGSTFAMVRTRSTSADLEGGIVIATEDNTQIFLNGSTVAAATINNGQWYRISGNDYVNQGSNHFNMFVSTTKNVYLYQLVSVNNSSATGGFNYIPPLNCYLPRKIDEIGRVSEMPTLSGASQTSSGTLVKLNILTEAGAAVTVNGVTPAATSGPFPVTGNTAWVTYGIEGVTGNLTIVSDKAVTAGINGGFGTAGYGGYFAGFASTPLITKVTGDCIPGIVLEVDTGYASYQWNLNGVAIPGATSNTYTPLVAGNYTCTITAGSCAPVTTPIFVVFACPATTINTLDACGIKVFTPTFTSSTQTVSIPSVVITTPPANGTAVINPATGAITYTPNPGYLGPDTFSYYFQGTTPIFFDSETVTVNLNVVLLTTTDDTVFACSYNNVGIFNLTDAVLTTFVGSTIKYYPTLNDLNNNTNQINNPTTYQSGEGTVHAFITTPEGCTKNALITLTFFAAPIVQDASITVCFIPTAPTTGAFDLNDANVTSTLGITKIFYPTLLDAQNGTNFIANPNVYISPNRELYVRVISTDGCFRIAKITLIVTPQKFSQILVDKYICVESRTTLDAGPGFDAYLWSTGATTSSITGVGIGVYTVLLTSNGCSTLQTVKVLKSIEPVITNIEITNNTATLTVTSGNAPYQYSIDNVTWQNSNVFTNLPRGQNTFYVKDSFNCLPVVLEVTVPNLTNVITPNGDNKNDYIDYSELSYKRNLNFIVYDRYGNKLFTADKNNGYRWDGKLNDRKIYTGTYWYHINWNESTAENTAITYSGWILIKNIE
ncbi:T9SS type B sorting domain-containing protein [Frigoriflavimonas asaccharolytica]|uniref:Gliding motility-associated-like protein n=1 Tax=Frigoriflavimonas asaccharolytica TaxID=2735899 RepID=A0A8J8K6D7_9FLAO|nr:T9SS type B sorting domain-containing protein [Frigoriflavimonas asaccharolytica]NRS93630.1 gliding motility-associated-like protein [Frigoriflavimonas asaccharolytica]